MCDLNIPGKYFSKILYFHYLRSVPFLIGDGNYGMFYNEDLTSQSMNLFLESL